MSLLALTGSEFFYVPTSEVLPVSPKASVSTFWSWDWAQKYGNSCRWDPLSSCRSTETAAMGFLLSGHRFRNKCWLGQIDPKPHFPSVEMGKEKLPAGEGKWPTLGKMETYCKKKEGGPSLLSPFSGAHGLIANTQPRKSLKSKVQLLLSVAFNNCED